MRRLPAWRRKSSSDSGRSETRSPVAACSLLTCLPGATEGQGFSAPRTDVSGSPVALGRWVTRDLTQPRRARTKSTWRSSRRHSTGHRGTVMHKRRQDGRRIALPILTRRKPLEWRPRESSPQALDRPTAWASTAELAQPGGHGDFLPESLPASLHTPLNRAAACSAGHRVRIRKPLPHPGLRSIAEADAVCMASETASESRRGWPPVFSDGVPRQAP